MHLIHFSDEPTWSWALGKASFLLLFAPLSAGGSSGPESSSPSRLEWHSPYVLLLFLAVSFLAETHPRLSGTASLSPSSSSAEEPESRPSLLWRSGGAHWLRALRKMAWILGAWSGRLSGLDEVLIEVTWSTHAGATFFPRLVPLPMAALTKPNRPFPSSPSSAQSWTLTGRVGGQLLT